MKFFIYISFLFSLGGYARTFKNNFLEFELPTSWQCLMEGTEWVCQNSLEEKSKEAVIIFAAKQRGAKDSLGEYKKYLGDKKSYKLPGGKIQVSDLKYSRLNIINNHRWVDSLHLASEIPGYYTRYLATVKEDLAIAVTFSVVKHEYRAYKKIFDKVASTVRVFRQKGNREGSRMAKSSSGSSILDETEFLPDERFNIGNSQTGQKSASSISDGKDSFIYIILAIVVIGFILLRKKR
jgi:hypothetical protein